MAKPNFMLDIFQEVPGGNATAIAGPKIFFPKDKEQFVIYANKKYKDYKWSNKILTENVKETNCRYDGLNKRYYLGAKSGKGSFKIYYIDV